MMRSLGRWLTAALVVGFVCLAGVYSVVNPLFESPDEVWHYEYVRWLVEGRGLPHPDDGVTAPWKQEGSQPPLYYWLGAALTAWIPTDNASEVIRYNPHAAIGRADALDNKNMMAHGLAEQWPWRGVALAAHSVRFLSVLLGAVTVLSTVGLARIAGAAHGGLPLLAGLLLAANPQFLFISASVSNDNLVTACCALGLWLLAVLLTQATPPSRWQLVVLGGLVAAASLSKVSGLALAGVTALGLSWLAWRRRCWRSLLAQAGLIGGLALLVAGWWYWRNWRLYGDPLGLAAMFAFLPGRADRLTLGELIPLAPGVWRSYWAVFGWFNVLADEWLYSLYTGVTLVGLAGWLAGWRHGQSSDGLERRVVWVLLGGWMLLMGILVARWAQISYPQGRLLFPAATAFATVLATGWSKLWPRRFVGWGAALLAILLIPPALVAPWRWIAPVYRPPDLLTAATPVPNPMAAPFGEQIELRGTMWSPNELRPGEHIDLTLYWRATQAVEQNYSVFVHLIDDYGILQAQRDSFPAGGALPTSQWPVGALIADRHLLRLPEVLPAPTRLRIEVGLYDFGSRRRILPTTATVPPAEALTLGEVTVLPAVDETLGVAINFGDQVALVDFSFDRWLVRAGESLTVTLHWQALTTPDKDYVVFVHLLHPPDAVWAQRDEMPQDGKRPTSTWRTGERVEDRYTLALPAETPPGLYAVEVGLYERASGERLKVKLSDAGVRLGQVRVVE